MDFPEVTHYVLSGTLNLYSLTQLNFGLSFYLYFFDLDFG